VDIIETLSVILAPSGRPLTAIASGSIAFTAKISGVPELLLTLSAPGGQTAIPRTFELPVFHPCVRLGRWKEKPGELSFIPPDGRFVLAGYEVDLLPDGADADKPPSQAEKLFLPASVDLKSSLGVSGTDFEVRLTFDTNFPGSSLSGRPDLRSRPSGASTASFLGGLGAASGSSTSPTIEEVVVSILIPTGVRSITDMRPSRGEAHLVPGSSSVEWHVPTKDGASITGTATLACTVVGPLGTEDMGDSEDGEPEVIATNANALSGYYDEAPAITELYQSSSSKSKASITKGPSPLMARKIQLNRALMPSSVAVSFAVKGWLPSGIRVDSLTVDPRRSRGLGEGVRPYKGVKYLCVSRKGVERRC